MAVNLKAKLALESKGFHGGLDKASKGVKGLGASFTKLKGLIGAGLALGGMTTSIKRFADAADEIDNLATRMGVSIKKVQQFQRATERSGQTMEVVADAYKTLKVRSQEAAAGNKILQDQFTALGISQELLESGNIDKMFDRLSDALTGADNRVESLAVGMKLLGEPVEKLVPVLDALDAGVGRVVSDANIKRLDKLQHGLGKEWDRIKTGGAELAGWLAGAFMAVTDPIFGDAGKGWEDPAKQAEKLATQKKKEAKSLKDIQDADNAFVAAAAKAKEEAKEQLEIAKAKAGYDKIEQQNLLNRLSDEEKLTHLKNEQNELLEQARKKSYEGVKGEVEYYDLMAKAAQLSSQIGGLEQTKKPLGGIRIQQSAMQQAGARIAGVDKRLAQLSAKQLVVQQEILKHIREGGLLIMGKGGKLNPYTGD